MTSSPAAPQSSAYIDLTMDAESLSELSEEEEMVKVTPASSKKPALKKSASSSALLKSSSSSSSKQSPAAKTKANSRKSEPTANGATAESPSNPSSSSSRTQVSDVVRARTHVNQDGGVQKLCHQHHQPCKGALLQCTFMRAPGKRCQVRYCFSSLRRFYDQDPETIVKSNRMMVNPAEHCPPTEAKYAWKCPRCRKKCDCATCRKAAGLEPLGRWGGSVKTSDSTKPAEPKAAKGKAKAQDDAAKPAKVAAAKGAKGAGAKGKERTLAEAVAAAHKNTGKAKSKASSKANGADEDDGIHTPPPQGSAPAAKKKNALASILSGGSKAPILKTLKPPTEVPPPVFELISTKLPEDNMRARMWIYESMVRFDKFGLNRSVLSQLDKFEHWTHAMVQDMLACLLKTIAGLTNIDKGHPTKPFVRAITSFRTHGKSLQRGEPWAAATELLGVLGLARTPLPHVEHDIPVEVEAAAAERSPSPPAARVTRARRAKENRQYDMARQLSMLDEWEAEEFGEAGADDDDDDDAPRGNGRARGSAKKSIYVYDDPSDDEDSLADPDDSARGRRSGRARRPVQKEPTPEVRLTGRQQAIRLQQEQQKEEAEQAAKQEQQDKEASGSRKRSKPSGLDADSDSALSDANSDDGSAGEDEHENVNGRSSRKRRRTAVGTSDDEAEQDGEQRPGSVNGKSEADVSMEKDTREMESPDLETKVSILSALIDAAVMADGVSDELKAAHDNIAAQERTNKAANADMEKELAEELAELNKRAPSIVSPKYQAWKAEKAALEHDHAWRRLDARVTSELTVDVHAMRTGPLGYDVDGREFWHLREYQERMPKFTEGRYAWCLVVLGPAFPVDPNQAAAAAAAAEAEQADANGETSALQDCKDAAKDEGDDSGLTSLDESSDAAAAAEARDGRLGLPTSLAPSNGVEKEKRALESRETSERVCMGANAPSAIKALIEYTLYRLDRVEYEENVAMQERERRVQLAKDADAPADDSEVESMYSLRKAKQALKDTQEERRTQVEQLVKRLHKSKEYFAWHREELAP